MLLIVLIWAVPSLAQPPDCADLELRAADIREMRDADPAAGEALARAAIEGELAQACPAARALLHGGLGSNLHILGRNEEALGAFERGLTLARSLADDRVLAVLERGAGVVLADLDRLDEALESYLRSLAASERLDDALESAKTSSNIGNLYNTLGDLEEARAFHLRALDHFERSQWPMGIAGASINLGTVAGKLAVQHEASGDLGSARVANLQLRDYNLRALAIFEELDNRRGVAYAANNVATALGRLGQTDESLEYHAIALELRREIGDRFGEIQSLLTMADLMLDRGDGDRAAELLSQLEPLQVEDNLPMELDLLSRQVRLAELRGEFRDAFDLQREITAVRGRLAEEEGRLRVDRLRESFAAEQRENEIATLRREAELSQLRAERQRWFNRLIIATLLVLLIMIGLLWSRYRLKVRASAELKHAARTDPLTGLANRRGARDVIDQAIVRHAAQGEVFSVIMADIDDFKPVNDRFGHEAGDQTLVHVARILTEQLKGRDLAARWGGEEFLIILPTTGRQAAFQVAGNLQQAVAGETLRLNDDRIDLSLTFGIAEYRAGESAESCIDRADRAMYQGKSRGKNRIEAE